MSLSDLGRILKLPVQSVKNILNSGSPLERKDEEVRLRGHRKLRAQHLWYLLSDETLRSQAQNSLEERCVMFHRQFPEIKLSRAHLGAIYKKHGITRKVIKFVKTLKPH
jgi:hypothetical protein